MCKLFEEITRRSMSSTEDGIACGPCSLFSADAEIAAEYRGQPVYFHGQWVDAASEDLLLEATSESLCDIIVRLESDGADTRALMKELDRRQRLTVLPQAGDELLFESAFATVKEILKNELLKNDLDPGDFGAFEDEYV